MKRATYRFDTKATPLALNHFNLSGITDRFILVNPSQHKNDTKSASIITSGDNLLDLMDYRRNNRYFMSIFMEKDGKNWRILSATELIKRKNDQMSSEDIIGRIRRFANA